jgi:class 3 adenylate cyclase
MGTTCVSCGFESAPGLKFCGQCGNALSLTCAHCRATVPPGFKFCGECGTPVGAGGPSNVNTHTQDTSPGARSSNTTPSPRTYTPKHLAEKILAKRSALEGERKQVTVLFADVKSSMELAEQVDAEEWHTILDKFFAILTDGVHRFEGTVNQYTGDGIMALFGAPIAHEDHAQRACYAALQLRDALRAYADSLRASHGLNFGVRIGLNSGEVVVGRIGDDLRMDYTAQGATVGLAQRMEQLAEPGHVLLTANVARLVEGYFTLRSLGPTQVKGSREPIGVHVLETVGTAKTRLDFVRARGLSKFVGRDDEIASLDLALDRATKGQGHVVGVVATAGTGKSRLCNEFIERCRRRGLAVYDAYCPQHGKTLALVPILELLRRYFRIEPGDAPLAAREKIAGRLLLLDPTFDETLPLLFDFLGVADPQRPAPKQSPDARQLQLFAFVRRWVKAESAREPLVIAIDDMHWIDDASDRFAAQIVEAAARTKTLVLLNFRPEYAADWTNRSWYQQLPLAPLTEAATRQLVVALLGADASLAGLAERIYERTAGYPFFTEEVLQTLIESGRLEGSRGSYRLVAPLDAIEVPGTVQAVLQARVDRLPEREKRLLQRAAVIGREFDEPLLGAVAELPAAELRGALAALVEAEYLVEQSIYPVAEYSFKHPLTQQVAEESQLRDARQRTHRLVAEALRKLHSNRVEEVSARLAHHWQQAGELLEAARWHRTAAMWIGISDRDEELRHWRSIHALADALTDDDGAALVGEACHQIINLRWRGCAVTIDERDAALARCRRTAASIGDDTHLVRGLAVFAANLYIIDDDVRGAGEPAAEALRLAIHMESRELEAQARVNVSDVDLYLGNLVAAQLGHERIIELIGGDPSFVNAGGQVAFPIALSRIAELQHLRGQHSAARATLQRSLDASATAENLETPCFVLTLPMITEVITAGVGADMLARLQRAATLSEKLQQPIYSNFVALCVGLIEAHSGDTERAIHHLRLMAGACAELYSALQWSGIAHAHRRAGRPVEAASSAIEAVTRAQRLGTRAYECAAQLALADALLAADTPDAARIDAALAQTESLIDATGARGFLPHVIEARSKVANGTGDRALAQRLLREARQLFESMGATVHAERLRAEINAS